MALNSLDGRHDARSRHRWLNRFQTVLLVFTLLIELVVASATTLRLYGARPLRSNEAPVIWSLLRALMPRSFAPMCPARRDLSTLWR